MCLVLSGVLLGKWGEGSGVSVFAKEDYDVGPWNLNGVGKKIIRSVLFQLSQGNTMFCHHGNAKCSLRAQGELIWTEVPAPSP